MLARCLLSNQSVDELRIFYSYARKDSRFRELIDDVLGRFKWDVDVRAWYDGEIPAGDAWEPDIFRHIDAAHIILLFVTRSFLASDYCQKVEVPRALARQARGDAIVIPLLIEDAGHELFPPALRQVQWLPRNGVPIERWDNREAAIRNVVQGIVDVIVSRTIDSQGRCRWQIHLLTSVETVSDEEQVAIVRELRTHAADPTLRPLAIGGGSVMMIVESSRQGFAMFGRWQRSQSPARVAGLEVAGVVELFGAGVQASVRQVESGEADGTSYESEMLLFPSPTFVPVTARGMSVFDDRPTTPDFVIEGGDLGSHSPEFAVESTRVVNFFATAVTVPESEFWVNLSPDETNRMLGAGLTGTEAGHQLLELDVRLKRLAASLMHPDSASGKLFWGEVFERTAGMVARAEIATFQRVWLVPKSATVYCPEHEIGKRSAFVVRREIEVLCEGDYAARYREGSAGTNASDVCVPIFKETILPLIERDVNEGKNFAEFRQIYCSLILATWFKKQFRDHAAWKARIDSREPSHVVPSIRRIAPVNVSQFFGLAGEAGCSGAAGGDESNAHGGKADSVDADARLAAAVRLRLTGKIAQAVADLRELLVESRRDRRLGLQVSVLTELGLALSLLGDFRDAREHHEEVVRLRRYALGDNHPATLESMATLATTLASSGDGTAAAALREEIEERKAASSEAFSIRENREFYERYMRVFRNGLYRVVRNEYRHDAATSALVARSYFSGAIDLSRLVLTEVGAAEGQARLTGRLQGL